MIWNLIKVNSHSRSKLVRTLTRRVASFSSDYCVLRCPLCAHSNQFRVRVKDEKLFKRSLSDCSTVHSHSELVLTFFLSWLITFNDIIAAVEASLPEIRLKNARAMSTSLLPRCVQLAGTGQASVSCQPLVLWNLWQIILQRILP